MVEYIITYECAFVNVLRARVRRKEGLYKIIHLYAFFFLSFYQFTKLAEGYIIILAHIFKNKMGRYKEMKQIKIITLLMLVLSIVLGSLTSCDVIKDKLGIDLDGIFGNETEDGNGHNNVICEHFYENGKCCFCGAADPDYSDDNGNEEQPDEKEVAKEEWLSKYETITIAEALTMCEQFVSSPSTERYYIIATVKSVDDTSYGKLMIEDETGEIMVYGTNSADGSLKYDSMDVQLNAGDLVLLYGTLQHYKGETKEIQNAWLIDRVAGEAAPKEPTITPDSTITIAEAIANAALVGETDRFYITATVQTVKNPAYGEMYIEDATGEMYVYGSYNEDGSIGYAAMEDKPYKGDTVTLYVTINVFNGTPQVKNARIISFEHSVSDINPDDYTLSSIADARLAADEDIVKVKGVVARITYANGMIPSGFILIDNTSSIYVYDGDAAARVQIGNNVTLIGSKDHWILESEQNNANKFGYSGCNQITNVTLVDNDNGNSTFDTSWITESTVKDIIETPVSEDISTLVYKVTALVKEVPGNGFTNYYFFDLDESSSSYAYSQCSGGDFEWVREFDGKICTVYLTALNAKSTGSDCFWRFVPVSIVDENYTFDPANAPEFAVKYHGMDQFLSEYSADPELELIGSVSSELLGFEGVTLTYTSSDENVIKLITENGKTVMHCVNYGTATVTVTASFGGKEYSKSIEICYKEPVQYDYISVEEAIVAEEDSTIIVKGIVGPSLVNKEGFYLMGENGLIAVITTADIVDTLSIGNEIILEGKRETYTKGGTGYFGQSSIVDAVVLENNLGNHEYNDDYFITDKTLADLYELDHTEDHTTEVYVVTAKIEYIETNFYTSLKLTHDGAEFNLYMSGAGQYSWMKDYFDQTVTLEIAPCNWNDKTYYRGCVLAIVLEDGTKILNTLNFDN